MLDKGIYNYWCDLYDTGVHIGDVVYINPENSMEVRLENALRLWKWEGGGLSLSAVANDCDYTISLPDRMDAVRKIAREALEDR